MSLLFMEKKVIGKSFGFDSVFIRGPKIPLGGFDLRIPYK